MRVLITGGGTGGHLYPALAVAGLLRESDPECEILFVGTGEGLESKVVPRAGYPFRQITAVKWPRKVSLQGVKDIASLGKGYLEGMRVIKEFQPHAVFATGGYVSVPLGLAAARLGIPLYLHEQNSVPGMANKLLSRWAEVTFTTFPVDKGSFPAKANLIHSGLPVRREILNVDRQEGLRYFGFGPGILTLLVTGGSRGARTLNQVMLEIYQKIYSSKAALPRLQILHLTGSAEHDRFCQDMDKLGIDTATTGKLVIKPYLEEMEYGLAAADMVISRAGAATLAEITARGIPAVLIPYPFATGDHQLHNARFLERQGAAHLITEKELTPGSLLGEIEMLAGDSNLRQELADRSRGIGRPEAGNLIAGVLLKTGKKSLCHLPSR